jgi:hypothetical protein
VASEIGPIEPNQGSIFDFPFVYREIFQRLERVLIMGDGPKKSLLAQDLKISVAVVEVHNGESQKEAWRRYLTYHPESVGVRIKIFHYPNPNHDKT